MITFFANMAALWNFLLFFVALATLLWFIYWFALRRLVRARRIEGFRMKRLMREASERKK